ncbi:hypothetical protein GCM10011379_00730 [Filimonas zeae]|uniref:Uncharacterized protein n=2 Tax=Filimonas zeae TaxID=1737353 RepID=A0A917MPS2_9BACT|nr:hypothetical protein GCM10011379_00730 [Filimonas zeae]
MFAGLSDLAKGLLMTAPLLLWAVDVGERLVRVKRDDRIASVAVPGLCTGVGRMQPMIAARQMYQAYREIMLEEKMQFKNFAEAQKYHWNINPQGMIWTH